KSNTAVFPIGQPARPTLLKLSADTGGRAFPTGSDLTSSLATARDMIGSHYILGYYSTNSRTDGGYRAVNVKVNRLDGSQMNLDYRHEYFAEKDFPFSIDEERLQRLLRPGDPLTDIQLAVEVDYFPVTPNRYQVPVTVKIPGSEIGFARSANRLSISW